VNISLSDYINAVLLFSAIIAVLLTFVQLRAGNRTQRANFYKDLRLTMVFDKEMREAFYFAESNKAEGVFDASFWGSDLEMKVDRLIEFLDSVCELYYQGFLRQDQMLYFNYIIFTVYNNTRFHAYLVFHEGLEPVRKKYKMGLHSSLIRYAREFFAPEMVASIQKKIDDTTKSSAATRID
jgi:hypothetical protein